MRFPVDLFRDFVAVRYLEPEGKLRLPDWQRTLRGPVIGVGPKVTSVAVGDVVLFGAAKGMESVVDNVPVRIMREDDLDAVL